MSFGRERFRAFVLFYNSRNPYFTWWLTFFNSLPALFSLLSSLDSQSANGRPFRGRMMRNYHPSQSYWWEGFILVRPKARGRFWTSSSSFLVVPCLFTDLRVTWGAIRWIFYLYMVGNLNPHTMLVMDCWHWLLESWVCVPEQRTLRIQHNNENELDWANGSMV